MTEEFTGGFQVTYRSQVCGLEVCTNIFTRKSQIFHITFFEFLGMTLFTFVVLIYSGIITPPGIFVVEVGMFFSLVFSGSYGCGYLNPALTLACCIKKENRITPLIGLYYWIIQYIAAFAGTFIAWAYNDDLVAPFPLVHPSSETIGQTFAKQLGGSFVFILCVLIMISSDTTFTRNNFQTWFCVPLCLIAVCSLFNLQLGTNPAQALAYQVAYFALSRNGESRAVLQSELNSIWSVIIGATLGGGLAGVIFEYVYRPFTKVYRQSLFEQGQMRKPLKIGLLNKSLDTTMTGPRRTTNIQMA